MKYRIYAGLVLTDERHRTVLLLKRSATKTFLPNFYSGIGGKVEPGETPEQCIQREIREEVPQINWNRVTNIRERLILDDTTGTHPQPHRLHWFTGTLPQALKETMTDFTSDEGMLEWHKVTDIPLPLGTMTAPAHAAIPYVLGLAASDHSIHHARLGYQGKSPVLDFV